MRGDMKVRYTVEIDVENDWDELSMNLGIDGRKEVVSRMLRRAVMSALTRDVSPLLFQNGICVSAMRVSEAEWDGWDNERITRELRGVS